jgi:site-specific DNA recombinase
VKRYGGACTNNRLIDTEDFERCPLADLKTRMLAPNAVSAYLREYHQDFAGAAADLGRDRAKVERKQAEAQRRKERMLKAFANGGGEFDENREMLLSARKDVDQLSRELANMDAVPTVITIHPHIEGVYRRQSKNWIRG